MLAGAELEALRNADMTYAEVGATQGGIPSGYHYLLRRVVVGNGVARFEEAARTVLEWQMHRRSGLSVRPSNEVAVEGAVAVLRLGFGPVGLNAPVRVIYVVNQPHRKGFAYGTLPGHPEAGEEAFVVELHDDGEVTFTITAFSRPSSMLAHASGPIGRAIQTWITNRYLRAVQVF
jgi:uncharacterized protein (UPF0548 family)